MTSNAYRPPASPVRDEPVAQSGYGSLVAAITPLALVSAGALWVVPQYAALFGAFGEDVPLGTRVLLATYRWWWLLLPAIAGMWWYRQRGARSQGLTFAVGAISALLLFAFGSWACYAPIFDLAGAP